MKVLVLNAGSSSIKYQLNQMPDAEVPAKGTVDRIVEGTSRLTHIYGDRTYVLDQGVPDHEAGIRMILETLVDKRVGVIDDIQEIDAVGHRVVHGGQEFSGSVIINEDVIRSIEKFADLAPLHNPPNLIGIQAAREALPQSIQVACFDTAFHHTIPEVAHLYALPYDLYERYHIRRYGFHGTSHRYVARRAAELLGVGKYDFNGITCHLGNGCSLCAIRKGRSVDTSMGMTPLEGLIMGTRCGDIDPAILFYLHEKGYDTGALKTLCNKQSGLLGVSGLSNDVRILLEATRQGIGRAQLALDMFCYRIKKYIGAYAALIGRLDAVIFTGGIGENAVPLREQICEGMDSLGISIDALKNEAIVQHEGEISQAESRVRIFVIPTNEELAIARDTYQLASHVPAAVGISIDKPHRKHVPSSNRLFKTAVKP